jgi:hypothetical protein
MVGGTYPGPLRSATVVEQWLNVARANYGSKRCALIAGDVTTATQRTARTKQKVPGCSIVIVPQVLGKETAPTNSALFPLPDQPLPARAPQQRAFPGDPIMLR